jgi:DNA polymerase I-like protein with 3'-5' exonuclease and polymerase domains
MITVGAQQNLFSIPAMNPDWRPAAPPELTGVERLTLDTETTGTHFLDDRPVGISIAYRAPDLRSVYLPFGHAYGNLDLDLVRRWARTELRGKEVTFCNAKFDVHQCRNVGIDLEALGVRPRDVSFSGALLDDNRVSGFGLNDLAIKYTGEGKVELPGGFKNLQERSAWEVADYAAHDARKTYDVDEATRPELTRQGLDVVAQLENDLIYGVCHIERNGARLNLEKLERWIGEMRREVDDAQLAIFRLSGLLVNPNSGGDLHKLLLKVGAKSPGYQGKKGWAGFTDGNLKAVKHEVIPHVLRARHADSILSKFLLKYQQALRGDTVYFQLHQLKGDEEFGAVSGRFSSSGSGRSNGGYGMNAQQVIKKEKQVEELGERWIIRELFIPDDGFRFFACDAKQIEYRLFGHYTAAPAILAAYEADPEADYHSVVMELLRPLVPGWLHKPAKQIRKPTKNVNFARLYGAGAGKIAFMLGLDGVTSIIPVRPRDVPTVLPETYQFLQAYDTILPEANQLMEQTINLARGRGWVKTILGRRARFGPDDRHYSALNRIVQGAAADIAKLKLRDTYRERATLGIHKLRQVVHDESCGDVDPDPMVHARLQEFFDEQVIDLKVPILWDLSIGDNWAEC